MRSIRYDIIKNENIIMSFENKDEAVEYAVEKNCDLVVKFDEFNFEPLGVVWEREE